MNGDTRRQKKLWANQHNKKLDGREQIEVIEKGLFEKGEYLPK
jgi:hypothetical protein